MAEDKTTAATEAAAASPPGPNLSKEQVPGGPLLIVAYLVIWLVVVGYLASLLRRARVLSSRVERLEEALDVRVGEASARGPAGGSPR